MYSFLEAKLHYQNDRVDHERKRYGIQDIGFSTEKESVGNNPQGSVKENSRMVAFWHEERSTRVDWSRSQMEDDSKGGFNDNDYANETDLLKCLTTLRGIQFCWRDWGRVNNQPREN